MCETAPQKNTTIPATRPPTTTLPIVKLLTSTMPKPIFHAGALERCNRRERGSRSPGSATCGRSVLFDIFPRAIIMKCASTQGKGDPVAKPDPLPGGWKPAGSEMSRSINTV